MKYNKNKRYDILSKTDFLINLNQEGIEVILGK